MPSVGLVARQWLAHSFCSASSPLALPLMASTDSNQTLPQPLPAGEKSPVEKKKARWTYTPRIWNGMRLHHYLMLLARNRFAIGLRQLPIAVAICISGSVNVLLWLLQKLLRGRAIARTEIDPRPIFVLGHWRTGTTLLHELLALDERHTYPNTYACFAPNHFALTRRAFTRLLQFIVPEKRPMDNMPVGWERPQEEEFALCNLGVPSPYLMIAFPNRPRPYREYLTLDGVSPPARERWKRKLLEFLRTVTYCEPGKRLVLKSPTHTARVRVLLEMFPNARFVHITRDPHVVFTSTVNLWKKLSTQHGLQTPRNEGLEEYVFETYTRMFAALERDVPLIPQGNYFEVRYEDLVCDTVGVMRQVYEQLDLGQFERVLPALEQYARDSADYKTNRWVLSEEDKQRIAQHWGPYVERWGPG